MRLCVDENGVQHQALGLFGKDTKLYLHKFSLNSNNILEILSLAQHEIPYGGNVLLRVVS